jgi:Xaa-Pro aminopeptidase
MHAMADVLIYGDTERSPEMRHEIPLLVPDPFLYAEVGGRRHVVASALECPRLAALDPDLVVHPLEEFGLDELVAGGAPRHEIYLEIAVRSCRSLDLADARVPGEFPLAIADRLRAAGIALAPDHSLFAQRRRVKSAAELAGIRRAQSAAEAGMRAAAALLRAAEPQNGALVVEGEPLTSERVKAAIRDAVTAAGASPGDDFIVSHGTQTAVGHEMGFGPIRAGEPVIIDLWPRDTAAACFADMTRTFVVGEVPAAIRRYHELTQESLELARAAVRAGVPGGEVHRLSCEPYHRDGLPTQLNKPPGEPLDHGFHHSLGHGVGLQVHEAPILGRTPDVLVAGDVVTLEPGCYDPDAGGCRLEDLVVVTDDGCETLTDFPYALEP